LPHRAPARAVAGRGRPRCRGRQRRAQPAHDAAGSAGVRLGGPLQREHSRGARNARPCDAGRFRQARRGRAPVGANARALPAAPLRRGTAARGRIDDVSGRRIRSRIGQHADRRRGAAGGLDGLRSPLRSRIMRASSPADPAMHSLPQACVFLLTAVLLVPLFQRLKLGAVLGYLGAGMLIGPWGLGMIGDVASTLEFAELGVVLLLFLVGLELQPSRLWVLRRPVFGLGGAQVLITGAVLALASSAFGLSWQASLVAGVGLALSSPAPLP